VTGRKDAADAALLNSAVSDVRRETRMSREAHVRAANRMRERFGEEVALYSAWPMFVYDREAQEWYYPLARYLDRYEQLVRQQRGERLFAALHSVIEAERRDWK
jgi:hypothetical protein